MTTFSRYSATKDFLPNSIYKLKLELINLGIGLICTLVCLYSYFTTQHYEYEFVVNVVIVLSGIHGGVSFSNLVVVKDIKEILFEKDLKNTTNKLFLYFAFISVPLVSFEYFIGQNYQKDSLVFFIRNYILSYASVGHYFRQLIGYVAIYNNKNELTPENKEKLKAERILLLLSTHIGILIFPISFSSISLYGFQLNSLTPLLITLPIIIILYLTFNSIDYSINKSLYLLRGISFSFYYHNPLSIIANKIIHSTEYVFLTNKILKHPDTDYKLHVLRNTLIILSAVFAVTFIRWGDKYIPLSEIDLDYFLYFQLGINVALHYWADNIFYSMKNKRIRETLVPRLTK